MKKSIDELKSFPGFASLGKASTQQIKTAEQTLGVHFSREYQAYISQFGVVSIRGHEFTGICASPRLNVIDVTQKQRALNPNIPMNLYVVEELNMDNAVIWQSEKGEIFLSQPDVVPVRIAASLIEYLNANH